MASITIRNIPDSLLNRIRTLSEVEKRSINSEMLIIIEKGLSEEADVKTNSENLIPKETQINIWGKLSGSWIDSRSTKAIIEDIYSARTKGRPVEL